MADLEKLGFHLAGYGCTTCIGNSGPVHDDDRRRRSRTATSSSPRCSRATATSRAASTRSSARTTSRRRRSSSRTRSPGTMNIDLETEPLGIGSDGKPVFLRDIWPSPGRGRRADAQVDQARAVRARATRTSSRATPSGARCRFPPGDTFAWDDASTYIRKPPFFDDLGPTPKPLTDISGARVLAILGDSVTTDHISPAGNIAKGSPAGALPRGARRQAARTSTSTARAAATTR